MDVGTDKEHNKLEFFAALCIFKAIFHTEVSLT